MWIFTEQGLLMPAAIPVDKVDPKYMKPGFDLQVRGRVKVHLERWADKYMAPSTYSDIEETPDLDYNVRFYCNHNDFAWAMGKAIADIDYKKFKPVAEKPEYGKEGKEYHQVLNSIWSTVTRLGSPGGYWAPWSPTNPKGYKPSEYSSRYTTPKSIGTAYKGSKYTGGKITAATSLFSNYGDGWLEEDGEDYLADQQFEPKYDASDMDWIPFAEEEAEIVIDDLRRGGIPTREWQDSCTENEWACIKPFFQREVRREKRENRKARRAAKRQAA